MFFLDSYVPSFWSTAFEAIEAVRISMFRLATPSRKPLQSRQGTCRSTPYTRWHAGRTAGQPNFKTEQSPHRYAKKTVRLGSYDTLAALSRTLHRVDSDVELARSTVVLILAANFSGHLPSLIQRSHRGCRLILVCESGRVPLPGTITLGDLAAREGALGWGQIVFERDLEGAINGSLQTIEAGEPLVILWPEWLSNSNPVHLLDRQDCQVVQLQFASFE